MQVRLIRHTLHVEPMCTASIVKRKSATINCIVDAANESLSERVDKPRASIYGNQGLSFRNHC